MITVTYTAGNYRPEDVEARYVRVDVSGAWFWCEVGPDRKFDLRQGRCEIEDVPFKIRMHAHDRTGYFPSFVDWPFAVLTPVSPAASTET